jgi:hypothetical protein
LERGAVMGRHIDVDELVDRLKKKILLNFDCIEVIYVEDLKSVINNMPIADVVEVVRCKDCKYQDDCDRQVEHTKRDYILEKYITTYEHVDYCSYGERKTNI